MAFTHAARKTFAVPAVSGNYAPETLDLVRSSTSVGSVGVYGVTALIEAAVASASVELWLLKLGGDPTVAADYFFFKTFTGSGDTIALAGYPGARIRVKSGGTAGNCTVSATAD